MFKKAVFEKVGFKEYRKEMDERIFERSSFENSNSCAFIDIHGATTVTTNIQSINLLCERLNKINEESVDLKIALLPLDYEGDSILVERATLMVTSPRRRINQNNLNEILKEISLDNLIDFAGCNRRYFNGIKKFEHRDAKDLYATILDIATFELYKYTAETTVHEAHLVSWDKLFGSEIVLDHRNDGSEFLSSEAPIMMYAKGSLSETEKWDDFETTFRIAEETLLRLLKEETLYISGVEEVLQGIGSAYGLGLIISKYRDSSLQTSNITMFEELLRDVYSLIERSDDELVLDHISETATLYGAFCKLNACLCYVRSNSTLLKNLVNKKRFSKKEEWKWN